MDTKRLLILTVLAMLTLACWLVGNERLSQDSRLFSVTVTVSYPASIIFGAGALAGAAGRARFLRSSRGSISLLRTGIITLAAISAAVLSESSNVLGWDLSWYFSLIFVLAYVFLVILRHHNV